MFNIAIGLTILLSLVSLNSVASDLFPFYYILVAVGIVGYIFFSKIGYVFVSAYSKFFYGLSIFLLLVTLVIGQVTRGTLRWIPIGSLAFQPTEFIRPFLLLFFANFLTQKGALSFKRLIQSLILLFIPLVLILVQPSLGVTILTLVGFIGVLLATDFNKKYIFLGIGVIALTLPLLWFLLAPYQKLRIQTFLNPQNDPLGAGYNSIQSVISVGSGRIFGKGLGKGVQTQLKFLPEKQTDFIFASIAEEMGFVGTSILIILTFIILLKIVGFMENSVSIGARAYLSGFFLMYLFQVFVHIGMNLGVMPVTGIPYPLVSSGGSSLIATLIGLGIAKGAYKG